MNRIKNKRANKNKTVYLKVATNKQVAKEVIKICHDAQAGKKIRLKETLTFSDWNTLLKAIASGRYALLKEIYKLGQCSIRALSQHVKRDYRNVHRDVKILEKYGLIDNKDNNISTQWANIVVELPLVSNTDDLNFKHKIKHKRVS